MTEGLGITGRGDFVELREPVGLAKLRWVVLAMVKNDPRVWPNYLHCYEDTLFATDGHRIHVVHNFLQVGEGSYMVERNSKTRAVLVPVQDEITVPMDRVRGYWSEPFTEDDEDKCVRPTTKVLGGALYRVGRELELCINPDYMKDALDYEDGGDVTLFRRDSALRVVYEKGDVEAIVMSMRV